MYFADAAAGQIVLVTADRRVAASGAFGGDSGDNLKDGVRDMARDVVKLLIRLSRGEAPGR
jgi:hypothetical protein